MKTALPGVLRLIAIILVVGGVTLGILDAYGLAKMPISGEESLGSRLPLVVQAVAMVLGMVGIGVLMYALAEMIESERQIIPPRKRRPNKLFPISTSQCSGLNRRSSMWRINREKWRAVPANLGDLGVADTLAGGSIGSSESMHQIMTLLQELRELSLLSDSQRQERLADSQHQRGITWWRRLSDSWT